MERESQSQSPIHPERRRRNGIKVALFVLALLTPSVGYFFDINDYQMLAENRRLAERPGWPTEREALRAFPVAFEKHFDDHFGFRSYLIGREKRLEWLGRRNEVDVQIGSGDWLFQGSANGIADQFCVRPADVVLEAWVALSLGRHERLAGQGVEFHWVIAPNKHTIYPEHMPAAARQEIAPCETERIADAFGRNGLSLLDLRQTLQSHRGEQALFHRTDSHWNQLGAAHGVREIIERLRGSHPAMPPFSLDDYSVLIEEESFQGNLASRLRVFGDLYAEPFLRLSPRRDVAAKMPASADPLDLRMHARKEPLVEFSTGRADLPTAVVFHDSFGFATMELLAEHFESIRFVNSYGLIDYEMLEENPPDIVISLVVELKLLAQPVGDRGPGEGLDHSTPKIASNRH